MNLRLLLCIAMGVFTAHIGLFMLLEHFEPKPKLRLPPKPNFSAVAETVVDGETGERMVYREITISTKLAPDLPEIIAETAAASSAKPQATEATAQ